LIRWIAEHGVSAACKRIIAEETMRSWLALAPDWEQSREYLRQHRSILLEPYCDEVLTAAADDPEANRLADIHRKLLALTRHHETTRGYVLLTDVDQEQRRAALAGLDGDLPDVREAITFLDGLTRR